MRIDTPTQNLESYFLDVVAKARAAATQTSGAVGGAKVAAYLQGDAQAQPTQERVLERLTLPTAPKVEPVVTPVSAAPVLDQLKLESLTKAAEPAPAPSQPAPEAKPATTPKDLGKANEKLSSLLKGKQ